MAPPLQPDTVQILVVWRDFKWCVLKNGFLVAEYAYRPDAILCARRLSAEAEDAGLECYMLVRDKEGQWTEHPCPRPLRQPA